MAEAMLSGRKRIIPSTVPSTITAILPNRVLNQHKSESPFFEVKEEMMQQTASPRYNSKDSGIELDEPQSPKKALYPAEPNLDVVRHELGKEGNLVNKAVWENTGLIPKFYKPYSLIETHDRANPVPLYRCHFCKLVYKGHNSIVYHCRRHIGDYPYKCEECGFVEVCKSGLSSHMRRTGHKNCLKIEGPDRINAKTNTPTTKVSKLPDRNEFASERIRDRSIKPKRKQSIDNRTHALQDGKINIGLNNKCARLTEALVTAGLGSFARESPLALTSTSSTSPKSETDNSDDIEEIENPSMIVDDKKDFSGIWETSEQRINTRAPSLPDECRARVVGKNVGLIPKFLKPFSLIRGENGIPIYVCDYCQGHFRGHNSIVYHTRRHIGDYPYRCGTCGYAEVSKCALNQHHANHRHLGAILLRYSRDASKTIDQVAEEIRAEVKANIQEQESTKLTYQKGEINQPVKRRKVDFTESNGSSSASSSVDEKPANSVELERRVAAILQKFGNGIDLQRHLNNLSEEMRLTNAGDSPAEPSEDSNIEDAPPLPMECENKVINENCGLIPRHYKPFEHIHEENGVQLFKCNYCAQTYRGHNSIIYHCRRHIGDYPYRCAECGFAEMSKAALNNHLAARRHTGCFVVRNDGRQMASTRAVRTVQNIKIQNQTGCGGLLDFSAAVVVDDDCEIVSDDSEGDFPSEPPTPTARGTKPDLDFLLWCAKNTERHRKPDVSWCFCSHCKSAFFNEEIFITHLSSCC